ncbi:hypothetical protein FisN_20Hh228 [Fistulifera solaris]|jgi:hypothetical protein|uniref:BZIP domain-containing protein n=1 Tax=Fistulifera solaris TaxID=1519565 RepID=A0A1Z5JPY7_FISSO|nr:hypothetical protein FisN_20Hh228 [Fistulifera solaris]|eukprot:GAX16095.1 hypothetical protein FisN_20Hh228 [Fistulifera solaris]
MSAVATTTTASSTGKMQSTTLGLETASASVRPHEAKSPAPVEQLSTNLNTQSTTSLPKEELQPLIKSSSSLSGHKSSDYSEDDEGDDSKDDSQKQSIRPSGSKRTLLTHAKDGKMLSEKKLRRLEKNRLSARECRRRKREATENLERQINVLEGENLRLRLQLQIGEEAEDSRLRDQEKLTQDIDDLLKSGASEADIYAQLEEFKEKHADYGKSRRSAIEFHLKNIERLLMPTQTTSLVLQAMQGGAAQNVPETAPTEETKVSRGITMESTAGTNKLGVANTAARSANVQESGLSSSPLPVASPTIPRPTGPSSQSAIAADTNGSPNPNKMDPKALFQYLVNYLEVTPEQAAALKDSRYVAQELDGCLETALGVLGELRNRLAQTGDDLETEFDNVRSILTPTQAAKFLVWVANNSACMHMLNELWDRVYGNLPSSVQNDETSP